MTGNLPRPRWSVLAWLLAALAFALLARPASADSGLPQDSDTSNAACLACHQAPAADHTLPSGDVLDVTVDPAVFGASAHASISCVACHTDITGYPHPDNPGVQDIRDYALMYKDACSECHSDEHAQILESVHAAAQAEGNKFAPVCSDCHHPHTVPNIEVGEEQATVERAAETAATCARCHSTVYEEYLGSVHGEGVIVDRNPDTPTCTDCHGTHRIEDPQSAEFRLNSPEMCAECHTDSEKMAKYGLSTQVLNTYVADFHGTTVTLFDKAHPEGELNKPVCYDCHGVHNILAVDDPEKGIQVQENMLLVCQKCHPDATENFPASWMSHYIASPTRFPLVYYVNLFYKIFIPGVLGTMGLYVLTDVLRKVGITRRAKPAQPTTEK